MKGANAWKVILVVAVVLVALFYLQYSIRYYTMSDEAKLANPELAEKLREKSFRLGLDIQGGLHLVMEIDTTELPEGLADIPLDESEAVIRSRVDQFGVTEPTIQKVGRKRLIVDLPGISDIESAKKLIKETAMLKFQLVGSYNQVNALAKSIDRTLWKSPELLKAIEDTTDADAEEVEVVEEIAIETEEKVEETEEVDIEIETDKVEEVVETETEKATEEKGSDITASDIFEDEDVGIASVDDEEEEELGRAAFSDLIYTRQGEPVIYVELADVAKVKRVLALPEIQKQIPSNYELKWGVREVEISDYLYTQLYLLKSRVDVYGDKLKNAEVRSGSAGDFQNAGQPIISLEFNKEGTKDFANVTRNNVNKQLAIVLSDRVYSAPRINDPILTGKATITGIRNFEEAKQIAIVLRTGALKAPLKTIQESAIGPSLGQDSVQKGILATIIGAIIVMLFMVIYYKTSGFVADFAIVLNMILLLAVMTLFKFTLTLPGLAGIILTVGMALDANVLIFERVREELKLGKTVGAAIEGGYSRAFLTIFDANLTTFITALVLYIFGSGAIKGFALTLMIGIVCSMFTAIFVTRMIFDFYVAKYHPKKLSI